MISTFFNQDKGFNYNAKENNKQNRKIADIFLS